MTPPEAPEKQPGNTPPAVSVCLEILKNRSEFLAAARARRQAMPSMIVQARDRSDDSTHIGVGYTCSKKVGNAVARNRAKRRLRETARAVLPDAGHPGWDYVLIGRAVATASLPFHQLRHDLENALHRLHGKS